MRQLAGVWVTIILFLAPARASAGQPPNPKPLPAHDKEPRLDLYGDPLPEGAIARLGTVRFCHGSPIAALAFSADGKRLVSAGGTIAAVWDTATGKELQRVDFAGEMARWAISPDGKQVAATDFDRSLWLADLETKKPPRLLAMLAKSPTALAFSRYGKLLASAEGQSDRPQGGGQIKGGVFMKKTPNPDLIVRIWDTASAKQLFQFNSIDESVCDLAFVSNDSRLVARGNGGALGVFDFKNGVQAWRIDDEGICNFWITPDSMSLVTLHRDRPSGQLATAGWHANSGKQLPPPLQAPAHDFVVQAVSADGAMVVLNERKAIAIYDTNVDGKEIARLTLPSEELGPSAVSRSGKLLAASVSPQRDVIRLWDTTSGKEALPKVPGHRSAISHCRFLPDGKHILSASDDGQVLLWDAAKGTFLREFKVPGTKIELSRDGKVLASFAPRKDGEFYDAMTGKLIGRWSAQTSAISFSPDGKLLAVAEPSQQHPSLPGAALVSSVRLLHVPSGKLARDLGQQWGDLNRLRFSLDGMLLACSGIIVEPGRGFYGPDEKNIHAVGVWDVASGKKHGTLGGPWTWDVFFPEGSNLLGIHRPHWNMRGPLSHWNVATAQITRDLPLDMYSCQNIAALSQNGRLLATLGHRGRSVIDLRELPSCKRVSVLRAARRSIANYAPADFAPDDRYFVNTDEGDTMLVWDLAEAKRLHQLRAVAMADAQVKSSWSTLGDPVGWETSVDALVESLATALPFLKERLQPVPQANIPQLIAELDSNQYATREKALAQLTNLEFAAKASLEKTVKGSPTLELRMRVEKILRVLDEPITSPDLLRPWRAVIVLEQIGTPEALQILEQLAAGAPQARLTDEARAALERMKVLP